MEYLLLVPVAYLLGSVPTGYVLVRLLKGMDIRGYGSGGTGVTNVLRTAGALAAGVVFLVDIGKGLLAVGVAKLLFDSSLAEAIAGIMAVAGHNWSVFIGFRGGRGVATAAGAIFLMLPWAGIAAVAAFIPVAVLTRYASLASLTGLAAASATVFVGVALGSYENAYLISILVIGAFLFFQHRGNIQRLLRGTERRIGQPAGRHSSGTQVKEEGA